MSFDVFFECFDAQGNPEPFSFTLFEQEFEAFAVSKDESCWVLGYPDGSQCELFIEASESGVSGFMIARPPAATAFWQSIIRLLQHTPSFLIWPGGGPVIAQPSVRDHFPQEMIEELGEPVVVSTGEEILQAIRNS